MINLKRTTNELLPVDLAKEADIADLLSKVEVDELVDR
ncbi:hypothetical protein JOD54_000759 [Actinokineospora baliensis]|nr:hypothetical protein [Actinokineospora baliensis]